MLGVDDCALRLIGTHSTRQLNMRRNGIALVEAGIDRAVGFTIRERVRCGSIWRTTEGSNPQ